MASNSVEFKNKFPEFIKLLETEGLKTMRPLAADLLSEIESTVPVDTGRYQDSWHTDEKQTTYNDNKGGTAIIHVYSDDPDAGYKEFVDWSDGSAKFDVQGWARYAFEGIAKSLLRKGQSAFQNLVNKI
jgi:hypothetical protein